MVDAFEPFSDASRRALHQASRALVAAIQEHTATVLALSGEEGEEETLFDANDELADALTTWDDAVALHTVTSVLELAAPDLSVEPDDDPYADELPDAPQLSIVSRFDLDVVDPVAVVAAGRAAHRRSNPDHGARQAAELIVDGDVAQALYAVQQEAGDRVLATEGLALVNGFRAYVVPEEPLEPVGTDLDLADLPGHLELPTGPIVFSESW